jgi:predicted Zn-dependent peptidase
LEIRGVINLEKFTLKNGIKIIYEHRDSQLTSLTIGFNAGAIQEHEFKLGTAHAVEHMVSKGTTTRTENDINKACHQIFGFENAMTNYSYTVYFGTCLYKEFERALDLYSDMLINPIFPEIGFREEMDIILEELAEWKDDPSQHCEDMAYFNGFTKRRIKNLIIGTEETVNSITLDDVANFYERFYAPSNCAIGVVSSLPFTEVVKAVEHYFGEWHRNFKGINEIIYEKNISGVFTEKNKGTSGAKIVYAFDIHDLNENELKSLNIFNNYFGQGTNSKLYEEIRTKNGLAYDVYSSVNNDRGINMFNIYLGISKENLNKSINIINETLSTVKNSAHKFNSDMIMDLYKNMHLRKALRLEKGVQLSKDLVCYELMYGKAENVYKEVENYNDISWEQISGVINRVLNNPTVQIVTP